YAHGTGGDFHSFILPRSKVAAVLAKECIAAIGMDQLHHGTRDGGACPAPGEAGRSSCLQLLYFNFIVPIAGRDNQLQSALDLVSMLRFARTIDFPAAWSVYDRPTKIDPDRIMFMGHSQGGLNGPLFMAVEPEVLGGVLSGAGSTIAISLEQKVEPFDLNELITNFAGLRDEGLDRWHPAATLLQTFIEPGDSVNFARYWFDEPPAGHRPKSVFMTVGMTDQYTPADAGLALAAAGRVPVINPVVQAVEALDLLGIAAPAGVPPYSGNVAGGRASAGVAQYENSGHFTIFEIPSATNRYGNFLRDLARFDVTDPEGSPVPGIY
ncbi:MAG: alpha/beta fold hydrolase, partial [Myxococcales bacterium]|nr:alpha/beta fold hydrolase [Myxococcales bacterium]